MGVEGRLLSASDTKQNGFTLIELMIVVAIIAILAAIAIPSYDRYVKDTKRTDMMTQLQSIANEIDSRKLINGKYAGIKIADIFVGNISSSGTAEYPTNAPLYTVSISPMNNANDELGGSNWILTANPKDGTIMEADGTLTLNYEGKKCYKSNCSFDEGWKQ